MTSLKILIDVNLVLMGNIIYRSKFPVNGGERAKEPLDSVHSDVCEWKALVETSTGRRLKVFRTDNGGEYTSTEFENYLKKEGITHQLTVPKTPEQNGVAERMNRTLVESVRSMLADAQLPHRFWAKMLSAAAYIGNRSLSTPVKGNTPFEAWTGQKPNVNHLRVFGCEAYAHVPKDEKKKRIPKPKHLNSLMLMKYPRPKSKEDHAERHRRPPDYYGDWATAANNDVNEPRTIKEALASPQKAKWIKATEKEMAFLETNEVWDLVEPPENQKVVRSKWVFRVTTNAEGTVERY
ncbi:Retrovirus-related Pol poly from transposon TNT 1-94 [Paramuricea clavata]|uniref:Retrovirus-related Pol poly from transposon TNT 1-94 n=1 Tax=Paramuricea clavata TaxID=317549 RepID=A0A6S7JVZ2_PARCT|nr:Retrovirus-related Pol poly from transposon TNT 1-94 [Paramuricea clavata]